MDQQRSATGVAGLLGRHAKLLGLNAALLLVLVGLVMSHRPVPAMAQSQNQAQPERPRGDYLLLGGEISGGSSNAMWIVDTANQEMLAVRWDQSRRELRGLGYRDLRKDLNPRADR
ncbi:MAG: hypothetical protein AAGG07_09150 [Planctomycetota bacterium]